MRFRRRRKRTYQDHETILSTCAWCAKTIPEGVEVFAISGKVKQGVDLKQQEGQIIPLILALTDKTILAIVPTSDSQAKREGKDILFMVCSDSCGDELTAALQKEVDMVDDVGKL